MTLNAFKEMVTRDLQGSNDRVARATCSMRHVMEGLATMKNTPHREGYKVLEERKE